jgi:hypothetical protein
LTCFFVYFCHTFNNWKMKHFIFHTFIHKVARRIYVHTYVEGFLEHFGLFPKIFGHTALYWPTRPRFNVTVSQSITFQGKFSTKLVSVIDKLKVQPGSLFVLTYFRWRCCMSWQ